MCVPWTRRTTGVSILAHPERWALRALFATGAWGQEGFQSSPTPKGGRYAALKRAPALRRCFNPRPPRKVGATSSAVPHTQSFGKFQSSPTPKGGRYEQALRDLSGHDKFQSSPTPKGGRYVFSALRDGKIYGFNPRPPRKVGATAVLGVATYQHARFQSSPTPKGGRYVM